MVMRKKVNYTLVTPIPSYIPRQLAIELLHSHGEIITLNPLVLGFKPIKAPNNAPADEYYCTWYEIEERLQVFPGIGRMGSSKIKFNGCFHDLPMGLQTHIYAPASVDLRSMYKVCGNQPGEPPEPIEMGIGAPREGLYLREDIEITCNIAMISFVKKETKAANKILVERLIKKAELVGDGTLQAMMENGRIKTINPADRTNTFNVSPGQQISVPLSPTGAPAQMMFPPSPGPYRTGFYDKPLPYVPGQQHAQYGGMQYQQSGYYSPNQQPQQPHLIPHHQHQHQHQQQQQQQHVVAMELPGDVPQQDGTIAHPPAYLRHSQLSELSPDTSPKALEQQRWSELETAQRWSNPVSEQESYRVSQGDSFVPSVSDTKSPNLKFNGSQFGSVRETDESKHGGNVNTGALNQLEGKVIDHQQ